ncbi:MAG: putative thiol:disulfide oxidoreductase TlpB [Bacteroidota bacterium]|jgi:thiol-disulfide isomerase/thioredoxin
MKDKLTISSWSIRIIVAGLFIISALGKIFPDPSMYGTISTFEVQQLYPMGFSELLAKYFSRSLIGIEFSLGILLLFPFNLKKWVIPSIILMLAVFCVHLSIELATKGNIGNCGCFGSLLPMTPLQAIMKNVLSIGLLGLLLWKHDDVLPKKSNYLAMSNIVTACVLAMFMLIPIYKKPTDVLVSTPNGSDTTAVVQNPVTPSTDVTTTLANPKDTVKTPEKPIGPKQKKSGFAKYYANIDEGKKLLCFFAPSCEHCQATAKELTEMRKSNPDFPEIQILFMDEAPEEIPNFFKFAGATYPHKVLEIIEFWNAIGNEKNVPGVCYLWNGNIMKFYEGTEGKNQFNKSDLKLQLQKTKK